MTTHNPEPPTKTVPIAAAGAAVLGAFAIGVGSMFGVAAVLPDGQADTVKPAPAVSVTPSPTPSADPTDGNGFGRKLVEKIVEQHYRAELCVVARPGVEPPAGTKSAIVERRGEDFDPAGEIVVFRMQLHNARHDSAGGMVLVHRWCNSEV